MAEVKRFSLVKPTLSTPFHIDFDWWSQTESNWRIHLMGYLKPEHQKSLGEAGTTEEFDIIDPQTAEVRKADALTYLLITVYARRPGFLTESSSLVESIFRLFLSNGNNPLTPAEIADQLHRPANTILQVLTGARIYRGLRPYQEAV